MPAFRRFWRLRSSARDRRRTEVGLGSGAIHGFLLFFGSFIDHGVDVQVFDTAEGFFYEAAAAEAPGSAHDFEGEDLFGCAFGCEFGQEGGEDSGVFLFFSFADEIVGGEEAEFEDCCGRIWLCLLRCSGRRAGEVSDEVVSVCDHVIAFFPEKE